MISAIFIDFQAIFSKTLLTAGMFLCLIKSFFEIQNTSRLSKYIDDCKFDHYLNSPNCLTILKSL